MVSSETPICLNLGKTSLEILASRALDRHAFEDGSIVLCDVGLNKRGYAILLEYHRNFDRIVLRMTW